jgi:hypothetical protein
VYRRVAFGSSGLLLAAIHRNHPRRRWYFH